VTITWFPSTPLAEKLPRKRLMVARAVRKIPSDFAFTP